MSARDDYPLLPDCPPEREEQVDFDQWVRMCDEIDRLRAMVAQRKELDEEMWHAYRMGWMGGSNGGLITRISAALRGRDV